MGTQDPAQSQGTGAGSKTIEFEGATHVFPADATDDEISKALGGTGASPAAKPKLGSTMVQPPPTSIEQPPESTLKKVGRGAALGIAEGLGAAQGTVDPNEGPLSAKNAISGMKATAEATASPLQDMVSTGGLSVTPGYNIARGLYGAADEAWKNRFENDPETYAHALGSAATQLLMLRSLKKGVMDRQIKPDKATSNIVSGLDVPDDLMGSFDKSGLVKILQKAGARTIGGAIDATRAASDYINDKFNTALSKIGNQQYIPQEIATRLGNLITPDMQKVYDDYQRKVQTLRAAGITNFNIRMSDADKATLNNVMEIKQRQREFLQPWRNVELNALRRTMNEDLNAYFDKNSQGQAGSPIQQKMAKEIRDGASEIVYNNAGRAGLPNAQAMKAQQGALWDMEIHLKQRADTLAKGQHNANAKTTLDKIKPQARITEGGRLQGAIRGVGDAVTPTVDPMDKANEQINRGSHPTVGDRIAPYKVRVHALPVVSLLTANGQVDDGTQNTSRVAPPPQAAP